MDDSKKQQKKIMHCGILFSIEKDNEITYQKKIADNLKNCLLFIYFFIIDLLNPTYVAVREAKIVKGNIRPFSPLGTKNYKTWELLLSS